MSNRSVYILVWNVRLGHEHAGLDFWLHSIACHAPDAPVFVVGTHIDEVSDFRTNKKVLLRELKRHTARRAASVRCADLSWLGWGGTFPGQRGGTFPGQRGGGTYPGWREGVPTLARGRGTYPGWGWGTYPGQGEGVPTLAGGRGTYPGRGRGYLPWPGEGVPTLAGGGGTYPGQGTPPPVWTDRRL